MHAILNVLFFHFSVIYFSCHFNSTHEKKIWSQEGRQIKTSRSRKWKIYHLLCHFCLFCNLQDNSMMDVLYFYKLKILFAREQEERCSQIFLLKVYDCMKYYYNDDDDPKIILKIFVISSYCLPIRLTKILWWWKTQVFSFIRSRILFTNDFYIQ